MEDYYTEASTSVKKKEHKRHIRDAHKKRIL